jgi:lipid-binding SYLF domain-containing protein
MKKLLVVVCFLCLPLAASGGIWDTIKERTSDVSEAVGDTVSAGAEAVTDVAKPNRSRQEIDDMAAGALQDLFAANPGAERLYEQSHGYAVFDSRKMSFMITTAFGAGVAVGNATGKRTYMKMGSGGINVGMGAQWYQVVFLFESESKFRGFVDEGWDAGSSASAAVWDQGASKEATFVNGLAVYQLTDKGLMLAADLTGTKYWKDDELNTK